MTGGRRTLRLWFLLAAMLAGCDGGRSFKYGSASAPPSSLAAETSISDGRQLTKTPTNYGGDAATVEPTSTSTSSDQWTSHSLCEGPRSPLPRDGALYGRLILYDREAFNFDLSTHQMLRSRLPYSAFSDTNPEDHALSPDGKWLAYIETVVDPANGRLAKRLLRLANGAGWANDLPYWREDWQWIVNWLGPDQLALVTAKDGPGEVTVLNPLTGRTTHLSALIGHSVLPGIPVSQAPRYNRALNLVAYPTRFDPSSYSEQWAILDIRAGKVLWGGSLPHSFQWSPDGKFVSFLALGADGWELLVVAADGRQLGQRALVRTGLIGAAWSPGSTQVATWLATTSNGVSQLAVIDVVKSTTTVYCVEGDPLRSSPSWSPDGRWLAASYFNAEGRRETVIVGPQSGDVYRVPGTMSVLAWMS